MKPKILDGTDSFARQIMALVCLVPLWNCAAAASLGFLVVYSDADDYKVLTGILSAANVGGWLYWLLGSLSHLRTAIKHWLKSSQPLHPGFRFVGLVSFGGAVSWIGVLFLLAYGMLG